MKKYIVLFSLVFVVGAAFVYTSEDEKPCPKGFYPYKTPAGITCVRQGMVGAVRTEFRTNEHGECVPPYRSYSDGSATYCLTDEEIQKKELEKLGYSHPKVHISKAEKARRKALRQQKLNQRRHAPEEGEQEVPIVQVPAVRREHGGIPRSPRVVDLTRLTEDAVAGMGGMSLRVPGSGSSSSAVDTIPEREGVDLDAMLASAAVLRSPGQEVAGVSGSLVRPGVLGRPLPPLNIAATQTPEARAVAADTDLEAPRHAGVKSDATLFTRASAGVQNEPLWRRSREAEGERIAGTKRPEREKRHERNLEALRYERAEEEASRGQTPVERQAEHDGSWGAGGDVPVSTKSVSSLEIRRPGDDRFGAMTPRAGAEDTGFEAEDEAEDEAEEETKYPSTRSVRRRVVGEDGGVLRDEAGGRLHATSFGKKYNHHAGTKRPEREKRHERKLEALRYERAEEEASRGQTPVERQAEHDGSWGAGGDVPVSTKSVSSLGIRRPGDDRFGAMTTRAEAEDTGFESEDEDEAEEETKYPPIRPVKRRVAGAEGGAIVPGGLGALRRNNGDDEE